MVGIASEFIGEEQRDEKAKTTTSVQCLVTFFRFYCLVTTHKLKFEFTSQTGSANHASSRLFSRGTEKKVEIWT